MRVVVDTNVLLVANGKHDEVSDDCLVACSDRLAKIMKQGITILDDGYKILSEYQNKTSPNQPKGTGDVFLKWLLQNKANRKRVEIVTITETTTDEFAEFPDPLLQKSFDPSDRKFVAVAHAHKEKPTILQAADCKWLDWWECLKQRGIKVEFLCKEDICRFYKTKFPEKPMPQLPAK